jgi:phospholipase C
MNGIIEKSYGRVFKTALGALNPIKRAVVKTECRVHKFINVQGVVILNNDGYYRAWKLFRCHIDELNAGVVYADQDLKSRNHFYNPESRRGLYGCSNALKECMAYYICALVNWHKGDTEKSMFYLGAACHLVQDTTVPQHVNVRLLKQHRKFENWVIRTYDTHDRFKCSSGGLYLNSIKELIETNALTAIKAYNRGREIKGLERRFYDITDTILCQAQRSTAGMLLMFYNDVCSLE